jgi:hypothetical protein
MGMDVYGKRPTGETGGYFRRNVWGWRPIADYCLDRHPALTFHCTHWHSNDGDGLNAARSLHLAEALERDIASGAAAGYIDARDKALAALPDEPCRLCGGSGIRADAIGVRNGLPDQVITAEGHPRLGQTGWCNGCDGRGSVRPHDTWYPLELNDLVEWAAFLRACGGFRIN